MATSPQELARLIAQQGRIPNTSLSSFGPNPFLAMQQQPQRPAGPMSDDQNPWMQKQRANMARRGVIAPSQKEDLPWYKDALGAAIGIPGVKEVLGGLDATLGRAGRAGTAATEHLARLLPDWMEGIVTFGVDEEKSRADTRSVMDRINGEGGYGYGQIAKKTGNEWADKAVGFAGDVVTDPTTYLTLGASAAAGKSARAANAAKLLADEGVIARAAQEGIAITDDLIRRTGKGAAWLNDSERALLGIEKSGARMAGVRIPGTGAPARLAGKVTGTARRAIMRPWHVIGAKGGEGERLAKAVLETGREINGLTLKGAAASLAYDETFRMTSKAVAAPLAREAQDVLVKMNTEERRALTHALELGDTGPIRTVLDKVQAAARAAGINVGDIRDAADGGINYMPHMWTEEGRSLLGRVKSIRQGNKVVDLTAESGSTMKRLLRGGEVEIDGVAVDLGNGSIDAINKALQKHFKTSATFLEDDATKLLDAYIRNVSEDIGMVTAFERLAKSGGGAADWLDNVSDEVLDKVKTRTKNKELKNAIGEARKVRAAAYEEEVKVARKKAGDLQHSIAVAVASKMKDLGSFGVRMKAEIDAAVAQGKSLDDVSKKLGQELVRERQRAEGVVNSLRSQAKELQDEIVAAQVKVATLTDPQRRLQVMTELSQRKMALDEKIANAEAAVQAVKDATDHAASMTEMARQIRASMDDPDLMQQITQDLVPQVDQTIYKQVGTVEGGTRSFAEQKLAEATTAEQELSARMATDWADEQSRLSDDLAAAEAHATKAAEARDAAKADLQDALGALNQARGRRVDAGWVSDSTKPLGDTRTAAGRASVQRQLVDERAGAKVYGETFNRESQDLADLETLAQDVERLQRRMEVMSAFEGADSKAAAEARYELQKARREYDSLGEKIHGAQWVREQTRRALENGPAITKDFDTWDSITRRVKLEESVQGLTDDIGRMLDERQAVAKTMAREQADQTKQAIIDQADASRKQLLDTSRSLPDAQQVYEDLTRQIEERVLKLPPAEQRYYDALVRLNEAHTAASQAEDLLKKARAGAERAKRRNTLDAELGVKRSLREYWQKQVRVGGTGATTRKVMTSETVQVPAYQVPLRAQIEERLGLLPAGGPEMQLGKKTMPEAAGNAATRKAEIPPSAVTDEMLAKLPEGERNAFTALRAEYDQVRTMADAAPQALLEERRALQGEAAGLNSKIAQGVITPEEQQRLGEVMARLEQVGFDGEVTTQAAAQMRNARVRAQELEAQLEIQTDFIARYHAAVNAGAPAGSELAARIGREVLGTRKDKLIERAKSLMSSLSGKTDKGAKTTLFEQLNTAAQRAIAVKEDLRKLYDELDKIGGADKDWWMRDQRALTDDAVAALHERSTLGAMIAETKDQLKLEEDMLELEILSAVGLKKVPSAKLDARTAAEISALKKKTAATKEYHAAVASGDADRIAAADRALIEASPEVQAAQKAQARLDKLMEQRRGLPSVDQLDTMKKAGDPLWAEQWDRVQKLNRQIEAAQKEVDRLGTLDQQFERLGEEVRRVDTLAGATRGEARTMADKVVDMFRLRGAGRADAAKAAFVREQFNPWFDELFAGLDEQARSRLDIAMREQLRSTEKEIQGLGAATQRLGLNGDKTVTADWRNAIFGTGERGTLDSVRGGLQEQLGLYDQAAAGPAAAVTELEQSARDAMRQAGRDYEVAKTLPDLQAERAALPSARDAQFGEADALRSQIGEMGTKKAGLEKAASDVQAVSGQRQQQLSRQIADTNLAADAARRQAQILRGDASTAKKVSAEINANLKKSAAIKVDKGNIFKIAEDLDAVVKALGDDPAFAPVAALHADFAETVAGLKQMREMDKTLKTVQDLAAQGAQKGGKGGVKGVDVMTRKAYDGWTHVAENLLPPEHAIAIRDDVARALENWNKAIEKNGFWKGVEAFTQFFKTYATATPGFHVRNGMSAMFMNASDGVSLRSSSQALKAWRDYLREPSVYLERLATEDPKLYSAFQATFGSGAGGAFSREEFASEVKNRLLHNKWTKWNKKWGENVEGPARLAMAIDTVMKGGSTYDAMQRITRVHFDYSQLSRLDQQVKLMVPFWTFMSRNLPLQIQQMWMRPSAYSVVSAFQQNFGSPELTPQWMQPRLPITLQPDKKPGEEQWGFMPDLPHLGLGEDMASLLDFRDPARMASNLNPMLVALPQAIANKQWRFGNPIAKDGNWFDRANFAVSNMLPPIGTAQRVTGQGRYAGQADEKILNFLGLPFQKLTVEEQQREAERRARG